MEWRPAMTFPMDKTEREHIEAAEKAAEEYIAEFTPEQVEQCGWAHLMMDLTHDSLLSMPLATEIRRAKRASRQKKH
jgi:hypothetical protein